jgi:hypothetical protein
VNRFKRLQRYGKKTSFLTTIYHAQAGFRFHLPSPNSLSFWRVPRIVQELSESDQDDLEVREA